MGLGARNRQHLPLIVLLGLTAATETQALPKRPLRSRCERVVDVSIPAGTRFPYTVPFERGASNFKPGDRIVIREVRGTRKAFEPGGIYRVVGEYTLGSAAEAQLALSVTAVRRGEGCTSGNQRGTQSVTRGSGTFDLAVVMPYPGHPHLTFYVAGRNAGGVYFGKGEISKK